MLILSRIGEGHYQTEENLSTVVACLLRKMKLCCARSYWLHWSDATDVGYYVVLRLSCSFVTHSSWKVTAIWNSTLYWTWGMKNIRAFVWANWMRARLHQMMCLWYRYPPPTKVCRVGFHYLGLISHFSFAWLAEFFFVVLFSYLALIYVVFGLTSVLWVLHFIWKHCILKSKLKAINTFVWNVSYL